jgi:hypothetical protein
MPHIWQDTNALPCFLSAGCFTCGFFHHQAATVIRSAQDLILLGHFLERMISSLFNHYWEGLQTFWVFPKGPPITFRHRPESLSEPQTHFTTGFGINCAFPEHSLVAASLRLLHAFNNKRINGKI